MSRNRFQVAPLSFICAPPLGRSLDRLGHQPLGQPHGQDRLMAGLRTRAGRRSCAGPAGRREPAASGPLSLRSGAWPAWILPELPLEGLRRKPRRRLRAS
jgi:hypothetical protein